MLWRARVWRSSAVQRQATDDLARLQQISPWSGSLIARARPACARAERVCPLSFFRAKGKVQG